MVCDIPGTNEIEIMNKLFISLPCLRVRDIILSSLILSVLAFSTNIMDHIFFGQKRWPFPQMFTAHRLTFVLVSGLFDPTFFGIFVCGPLQSLVVNVCTL